jgi:hypothetical protein
MKKLNFDLMKFDLLTLSPTILWIKFDSARKSYFLLLEDRANDHKVEFHEIQIRLFHEIEKTIMRLKFALFMRLNLSIIFHNFDQEVDTLIMR